MSTLFLYEIFSVENFINELKRVRMDLKPNNIQKRAISLAEIVYDYMKLNRQLKSVGTIFVLGDRDDCIITYAAELYSKNLLQ